MRQNAVRKIDEFVRNYQFKLKDNKHVSLHNLARRTWVDLNVGQLYLSEISYKKPTKYVAVLTDVEFKKKLFFSVTVDLYTMDNRLFKSGVYFYNPPTIFDRASRFPLHQDTISNNVAFWSTLELASDQAIPHHSYIEFLRLTMKNKGKECRLNIRETQKKSKDVFSKLDAVKNRKNMPTIRMEHESSTALAVYGIQKNQPMQKLMQIKTGDTLLTKVQMNGSEQEHEVAVVSITETHIRVQWEVKEGGLTYTQDISLKNYKDPFWRNLVKVTADHNQQTNIVDFLAHPSSSRKTLLKTDGGGRRRATRRRQP
jgi:hypothetical protein